MARDRTPLTGQEAGAAQRRTNGQPAEDALADLVAVMDRLRSPGGCPWDAEQTHESLLRYAVEEVHEVVEAVEAGDRAGLREELGDLLLQVVFHARVAQEHPEEPFDLQDVAAGIAAKLRRRHPHVFADPSSTDSTDSPDRTDSTDSPVDGAEDVHRRWERLKQAEKQRRSALDGIPPTLPALARAQKVLGRAARADLLPDDGALPTDGIGARLLALAAEAERSGLDAEAELRRAVREVEDAVRAAEGPPATAV